MEDLGEWIFSSLGLMMVVLLIPIVLLFASFFVFSIRRSRRRMKEIKYRRRSLGKPGP